MSGMNLYRDNPPPVINTPVRVVVRQGNYSILSRPLIRGPDGASIDTLVTRAVLARRVCLYDAFKAQWLDYKMTDEPHMLVFSHERVVMLCIEDEGAIAF